jgi:hypothetical protein
MSSFANALAETYFFRGLPLLGYALLARGASAQAKLGALGLLVAAWLLCRSVQVAPAQLAFAGGAWAYVAASSIGVQALAAALQSARTTRAAVAVMLGAAYLLAPGLLLPPEASVYFLALGWESALAAYSYCVELPKAARRPRIADCCFFLAVTPLLVYPAQGLARTQAPRSTGCLRALLGLGVIGVGLVLSNARQLPLAQTLGRLHGYTAFLVNGAWVFAARYASLSGLASLQIGSLRTLGYELPERYNYPFLARSPLDFWRRWNMYIGAWFKHYVFTPLGLAWLRSEHALLRKGASLLALAATMLGIGLFHDLFVYASELRVVTAGTLAFSVAALAMVSWNTLARLRVPALERLKRSLLGSVLAHLAVAHVACAVLWFFTQR